MRYPYHKERDKRHLPVMHEPLPSTLSEIRRSEIRRLLRNIAIGILIFFVIAGILYIIPPPSSSRPTPEPYSGPVVEMSADNFQYLIVKAQQEDRYDSRANVLDTYKYRPYKLTAELARISGDGPYRLVLNAGIDEIECTVPILSSSTRLGDYVTFEGTFMGISGGVVDGEGFAYLRFRDCTMTE